jgi:hypothetical protein
MGWSGRRAYSQDGYALFQSPSCCVSFLALLEKLALPGRSFLDDRDFDGIRIWARTAALVHGHLHCLALGQIGDMLSLHVDLSVHRIIRHFFTDPTWEVDLLICLLQLNLCKHYTI